MPSLISCTNGGSLEDHHSLFDLGKYSQVVSWATTRERQRDSHAANHKPAVAVAHLV